jgi:hypothetical protein
VSVPKVAERFEQAQKSFPHVDSMELMAASEDFDLSPVALVLPHRDRHIERAMPLPREGKFVHDESMKLAIAGREDMEEGVPHAKQVDSMIGIVKRISFEGGGRGTEAAKGEGVEDCRDVSSPLHLQRQSDYDSDSDCYHGEDEEEEDGNTNKPKQLKHVNSMLLISDLLASSESEPSDERACNGEECANLGEESGVRFTPEEKLPCKTNKWDQSLDSAFDVRPERVLGGIYKSLGSCSLPHVDSCEMLSLMAAGLDTDDHCPSRSAHAKQKHDKQELHKGIHVPVRGCRYMNDGDTRG